MFKKDPCLTMSTSPHSPHSIVIALIRASTKILDVGCNTGFVGKALRKKKVVADGIDINEKALKIAARYYQSTFIRDLYLHKLSIPKRTYDYILFIDILEHLPRPDLLLQDAEKYLEVEKTIPTGLGHMLKLFDTLTAFQFIYVCRLK